MSKSKCDDKLFVVRIYVKARNAPEALRKAKGVPPHDVYISDDWKEGKNENLATAIGFNIGGGEESAER